MKMTLAARVMANKVNVRFPGRVERRVEFGSGVNKSPAGRLFGTAEDPQKADRIAAAR